MMGPSSKFGQRIIASMGGAKAPQAAAHWTKPMGNPALSKAQFPNAAHYGGPSFQRVAFRRQLQNRPQGGAAFQVGSSKRPYITGPDPSITETPPTWSSEEAHEKGSNDTLPAKRYNPRANLLHTTTWSEHKDKSKVHLHLKDYPDLVPVADPKFPPKEKPVCPPDVRKKLRAEFEEHYADAKKPVADDDDRLETVYLNSQWTTKLFLHESIYRADMRAMMEQLGAELDKHGVPVHNRPTLLPPGIYGK